jgi:hypothetical protein
MENKPKISMIGPSIRPELWKQFCDSLANNIVDWEVVFVGPKGPVCDLPSNFRWIKSNVKPSQCTHIAFMEAKGEYVSLTADDAQYFTPNKKGALDNMIEFIEKFPNNENYNKNRIAYGFRMFEDSFCVESSQTHYLVPKDKNPLMTSTLLYPFFIINKLSYEELGGYDRRFICGQAENDFLLRVAEKYGSTANSLCPTAMVWADHDAGHENKSKFREYHQQESNVLRSLWLNEKGYENHRLLGLASYDWNDTIYTRTQGNPGEWR